MTHDLAKRNENAVASPYANPWLEAEAEVGSDLGKILKFVDGVYKVGEDEVEIGTKFVAQIHQVMRGWVKFENGKPTEKILGKLADGFKMPKREELSDVDESLWEDNRDPWSEQWYLPLISESDERHTFVTASDGGASAVGALCGAYGRSDRTCLPIVALRAGSYTSKKYHKKIHYPEFFVAGWNNPPKLKDQVDDEVPF